MSESPSAAVSRPPSARLTSLDQFRGYTMFGMLLVNFLGAYKNVCPYILRHHHDYCSYADTIMPQFLFAAGFAMRLSLGKRLESGGQMPWGRAIRRVLGLALVAILWYGYCDINGIVRSFQTKPIPDVLYVLFKRNLYQTLMHIAVTSLWILPVITLSWKIRAGYAVASGLLHILLSYWFNFDWAYGVNGDPSGIDGGPLGFLTWSICALSGTLACDAVRASGPRAALRIALCGLIVMLIGWTMSCATTLYDVRDDSPTAESMSTSEFPYRISKLDPKKFAPDPVFPTMQRLKSWDGAMVEPPFVPPPKTDQRKYNYWMMSQRGGTITYTTFAAGFSLVVYALFLWACDGLNLRLGFFRTLGTNSLAAYCLADVAGWIFDMIVRQFDLKFLAERTDSPGGAVLAFVLFTTMVYGACRLLEKMGWYLRV